MYQVTSELLWPNPGITIEMPPREVIRRLDELLDKKHSCTVRVTETFDGGCLWSMFRLPAIKSNADFCITDRRAVEDGIRIIPLKPSTVKEIVLDGEGYISRSVGKDYAATFEQTGDLCEFEPRPAMITFLPGSQQHELITYLREKFLEEYDMMIAVEGVHSIFQEPMAIVQSLVQYAVKVMD